MHFFHTTTTTTMRVHLVPLAQRTAHALPAPLRAPAPRLYSDEADADPSRCPFFGGPNGGGFGDANIATAMVFITVVFLVNRLIVRGASALAPATATVVKSVRRLLVAALCLGRAAAAPAAPPTNKSVAVLIAPGFYLVDAMGPLDVFRAVQLEAYAFVNLTSHEFRPGVPGGVVATSALHVDLLGASSSSSSSSSGVAASSSSRSGVEKIRASDGVLVTPDASLSAPPRSRYDLVVIPAGADTPAVRAFVTRHYAAGGAILSVCTGAGLVAGLGLLDGREATSNSLLLWRMRRDFPRVKWVSLRDRTARRFVVSQPPLRIVTTAGVTAGIDGALHFVAAWQGKGVAEAVREFVEWPLPLEALER